VELNWKPLLAPGLADDGDVLDVGAVIGLLMLLIVDISFAMEFPDGDAGMRSSQVVGE
jgi:hypothetical protein